MAPHSVFGLYGLATAKCGVGQATAKSDCLRASELYGGTLRLSILVTARLEET